MNIFYKYFNENNTNHKDTGIEKIVCSKKKIYSCHKLSFLTQSFVLNYVGFTLKFKKMCQQLSQLMSRRAMMVQIVLINCLYKKNSFILKNKIKIVALFSKLYFQTTIYLDILLLRKISPVVHVEKKKSSVF